jgi:rare lipoprotein A
MRNTPWLTLAALVCAAVAFSGCHKKRVAVPPPPPPRTRAGVKPPPPPPAKIGQTETGMASWYGHPYHGRRAANGEIYDMETLVAAHRTLPFDTWLHVINLSNQKSVDVRVIDRGPFVDGRIIDLSHAAARQIELIGPGVAKVRLEVIRAPESTTPGAFAVQVGVFINRDNAERVRAQMASRYGAARITPRAGSPEMWRVLVGSEPTEDAANALADRIRKDSPENKAGFVVRIDSM